MGKAALDRMAPEERMKSATSDSVRRLLKELGAWDQVRAMYKTSPGDPDAWDREEAQYKDELKTLRATLGNQDKDTLASIYRLAALLYSHGKSDEAEVLCKEAFAGQREKLGPTHQDTLISASDLIALLWRRGKHEEAKQLAREAVSL